MHLLKHSKTYLLLLTRLGYPRSSGAMVLGKLTVPGRPTYFDTEGQGPAALTVGAGGVVWTFFLSSIISLFFLPLSGRRPDIDLIIVSKGR